MAVVGSIVINASMDTSLLGKGAQKASAALSSFGTRASSAISAMGGMLSTAGTAMVGLGPILLAAGAALATAGAAAGAAILGVARESAAAIDELADTAARLGTTTEMLGGLRYAAQLTGSETASLDAALQKMSANLGDAAVAGTPAANAFKRLGLDAKALAQQDPGEAFKAVLGKLAQIPTQAERASAAMDIFGKGGLALMSTLSAGPEQVDKLMEEFKGLGGEVSGLDAAKIGSMWDAFDHLQVAISGAGNKIAVALAPAVQFAADALAGFIAKWATADNINAIVGRIGDGIRILGNLLSDGVIVWKELQLSATLSLQSIIGNLANVIGEMAKFLPVGKETAEGIADNMGQIADNMDASVNKMTEELEKLKKAPKFGDQWKGELEKIVRAAKEAAEAAKQAGDGMKGLGGAAAAVAKSVDDLNAKLLLELETFGRSGDEVEIYKLKLAGATEQQLTESRILAQMKKDMEENATAMKNLDEKAKQLKEDTKTPLEKFVGKMDELDELKKLGKIDDTTYARSEKAASKEFADSLGTHASGAGGAAEAGSMEAASAIAKFRNGGQTDAVKIARQQLEIQRQTLAAVKGNKPKPAGGAQVVDAIR